MRRFVWYGLVLSITFAFGLGVSRLIQYRPANEVAELSVIPLPATPVVPVATPVVPVGTTEDEPNPPPATLIRDYDRKKIVRYGVFFIYGRTPREFADFNSIELDLAGAEPPYDGYISVYTGSVPDYDDVARATFALATERRLFFVTSPGRKSEIGYRFDGEFLTRDLYTLHGKNKAALRGTLTKTKNGRKIAESVVSFRVEHLGC